MENQDVRWKQRFQNFGKALSQLTKFIEKGELNELEEQGLIQSFEYTHELAWNVMKDFLIFEGIQNIVGSRSATREAFNKGLFEEGQIWMDMIESRNESVHTYNEETVDKIAHKIKEVYFLAFINFNERMKTFL
ncbi:MULTISPECIES: nucleotidyltransferase substrate binding protein [Flavobacterium]|uniref:Nucleotidyltransferase n=1 Tax=Flavobacterium gawalongense TaxID=2594432 RepID=A0A553BRC1_9FLAO|nr:nucleotidyltransferase substrate binding protein [Flavobacterium gawalongense]TRX03411.1 nucleotidyltransferase [Flavobacterium gawalongense]TRX06821.1 nucleotidyltransferase [Flavobacterium gawalongense]TRX10759.1 nucleotidyltransferase [Flavobacterium gawalongense]TRX11482.1 nucleotidyltransferase [Flavobacterium gawalongense]TRX29251.1 nucleotidyltransferase [Flavobacterium gawalongense]